MEKTTIYLTTEQQAELAAMSRRTGKAKAELIRDAVDALVVKSPRPLPSSFGSVRTDGAVNSENQEEWLAENWKPDW